MHGVTHATLPRLVGKVNLRHYFGEGRHRVLVAGQLTESLHVLLAALPQEHRGVNRISGMIGNAIDENARGLEIRDIRQGEPHVVVDL